MTFGVGQQLGSAIRRRARSEPPVERPLVVSPGHDLIVGDAAATFHLRLQESMLDQTRAELWRGHRREHSVVVSANNPRWLPLLKADSVAFLEGRFSAAEFIDGVHEAAEKKAWAELDRTFGVWNAVTLRVIGICALIVVCISSTIILLQPGVLGIVGVPILVLVSALAITIDSVSTLNPKRRAVEMSSPSRISMTLSDRQEESLPIGDSLASPVIGRTELLQVIRQLGLKGPLSFQELLVDAQLNSSELRAVIRELITRDVALAKRDLNAGNTVLTLTKNGRRLARGLNMSKARVLEAVPERAAKRRHVTHEAALQMLDNKTG